MRHELRPTPIVVRQEVRVTKLGPGVETFRVPAWGYLEAIELSLPTPIPLMDGADYFGITVDAKLNNSPVGGWRVFSVHRNVEIGQT